MGWTASDRDERYTILTSEMMSFYIWEPRDVRERRLESVAVQDNMVEHLTRSARAGTVRHNTQGLQFASPCSVKRRKGGDPTAQTRGTGASELEA